MGTQPVLGWLVALLNLTQVLQACLPPIYPSGADADTDKAVMTPRPTPTKAPMENVPVNQADGGQNDGGIPAVVDHLERCRCPVCQWAVSRIASASELDDSASTGSYGASTRCAGTLPNSTTAHVPLSQDSTSGFEAVSGMEAKDQQASRETPGGGLAGPRSSLLYPSLEKEGSGLDGNANGAFQYSLQVPYGSVV